MTAVKISSRKTPSRGLTLPEVLIAGSLLLLVLGVSMELTRMAYNTFQKSTTNTEVFRRQTLATDLLNRELRLCTELLSPTNPDSNVRPAFHPGGGDPPLVFRRFSPTLNAETVVSYRFNPSEKTLIRETYEPQYDPRRRSTQVISKERSPKVVATDVTDFVFSTLDPDDHYGAFLVNFQLEVVVGKAKSRIGSSVRVRSI